MSACFCLVAYSSLDRGSSSGLVCGNCLSSDDLAADGLCHFVDVHFTMIVSGANPIPIRMSLTWCLWSPCSSIVPVFAVPPHARRSLSFFIRSLMLISFSSIPLMTVYFFPNFSSQRSLRSFWPLFGDSLAHAQILWQSAGLSRCRSCVFCLLLLCGKCLVYPGYRPFGCAHFPGLLVSCLSLRWLCLL